MHAIKHSLLCIVHYLAPWNAYVKIDGSFRIVIYFPATIFRD
jgi:hypothetical protein